ncbi:MAG: MASE1 domain-containing protein [Nitrospirota bacterium]
MSRLLRLFSRLKPVVVLFATAAIYVATARLGLTLALPPEYKATAVWPPSGIALAAVLLVGYRVWPGIWVGAFLANFWDFFDPTNTFSLRTHLAVSSGIAAGSTMQALLGAVLLRHWIGRNGLFDRAGHVFQFVWIAPLICVVASTVGVATMVLAGFAPLSKFGFDWWTWWLGDTVGILVVTPFLLIWNQPPRIAADPWRLVETGLLTVLLVSVGLLIFGGWSPWQSLTSALAYITVPLLVLATFRFGQHGATAGLVLMSGIAIWGTVHHHGPFVQNTLYESLLLLQTFIGVLAVTALVLAAVLVERTRGEEVKGTLIEQLEQSLHEIKTLRGMIPICAWCKKIRNDAGSWDQLEVYLHDHTEAAFSHGICPECFAHQRQGDITTGST